MRLTALAVVALTATLLNACVDSGTTRPSETPRLPAVDTAAAQRLIIRPFQPRASTRRNERLSYRFMVERI
ncbi:hypothetical protein [Thiocystis violascens]|uniref:Uncharacterized protein n=1 Tax=Thiocystis violascens (strain ATCC 17096 / DSM 198 / 6111) TaxID=765911 RepID=I3YGI6_THIV6|nr:hypothetical protein [Thiocystis violascens]AFL76104.1 hypothetical protein Thivi_4291 [Thiocystis violascens DSM 198]